jgi:hypothetical protein
MADSDGALYFTFVWDWAVKEVGLEAAVVYGVIYRYCHMKSGKCYASTSTMAEQVGMTRQRFSRHMGTLLKKRLVIDLTPDAQGVPHEYKCAERSASLVSEPVTDCDTLNLSQNVTGSCDDSLQVPVTNCNTRNTSRIRNKEDKQGADALGGGDLPPDSPDPVVEKKSAATSRAETRRRKAVEQAVTDHFIDKARVDMPPKEPGAEDRAYYGTIGALWRKPVRELCRMGGYDLERTKKLIDETIRLMRSKNSIIASPKSLLTIANMLRGEHEQKAERARNSRMVGGAVMMAAAGGSHAKQQR